MHADIFCVCLSASLRDGILSINGVLNSFSVPSLPAHVKDLVVVARIRFDLTELGVHQVKLTVTGPQGDVYPGSFESPIEVAAELGASRAYQSLLIGQEQFAVSERGAYTLSLYVDDQKLADCMFDVSAIYV